MSDLRVFPCDAQSALFAGKVGLCMRGCRTWAAQHGFDWASFVREGVPASDLLATGDPFAEATVEAAQKRAEAKNG